MRLQKQYTDYHSADLGYSDLCLLQFDEQLSLGWISQFIDIDRLLGNEVMGV